MEFTKSQKEMTALLLKYEMPMPTIRYAIVEMDTETKLRKMIQYLLSGNRSEQDILSEIEAISQQPKKE